MRQSGLGVLCATLALVLVVPAQAQENGVVRLEGLPQRASVYIDGKNVTVEQRRITVPVGRHEIQVEARRPDCWLSAFEPNEAPPGRSSCVGVWRVHIQVEPGQTISLPVQLRPVEVVTNLGAVRIEQGPPGPMGSIGPAGPHQMIDATALRDEAAVTATLRHHLTVVLADLYERTRMLRPHIQWYREEPHSYWFSTTRKLGVFGAAGPAGPPGPAGLPALVRQLQDSQKALLLDRLLVDLGAEQLRQQFRASGEKVGAFSSYLQPSEKTRTIPIYNPTLRALLARQEELWSHIPHGILGPIAPDGPAGPRGPMGPPGVLTVTDPVVTLDEAQVAQITATLREDAEIKRWLNLVEAQLQTLERDAAVKSEESK